MKKIISLALLVCLASLHLKSAAPAKGSYSLVKKISVEGDNGWDYITVDEETGRLFVSHGLVTQVVDSKSGKLLATIGDTKGVHGVALARGENKAYISCGKDSSVTIINLTSLAFIKKIKVTGANPDAILYDSFTHRVFTFNGRSSNSTVIDTKTDSVIATIPLPGKPEFSVSDGNGKIYTNIEDKSLIAEINSQTLQSEHTWSLAPGEEPSGLALDNTNHKLFSVCDNKKMIVLNAITGKVITSLPIGEQVDGCAFDSQTGYAFSSNGDGTLTIVHENGAGKFSVIDNVATQKGARTICVDTKTHHVFLPAAEYGETPKATPENPHPRPAIKAGTFVILDMAPEK